MVDHGKVIEKIRKLLALAASANEHEAALAAEKAQGLLAEYNLKLTDVEQQEEGFEEAALASDSRPWRRTMAANVARLYFCDYYFQYQKEVTTKRKCGYIRYDIHVFVGAAHNVMIAKSIFEYLCQAVERAAMIASLRRPVRGRQSFYTSFLHGCADRVAQRLASKYAMVTDPGHLVTHEANQLPALYNKVEKQLSDYLDKQGVKEIAIRDPKLHSLEGAMAGRKAGDQVGLDVQVGGQNKGVMLEDNSNAKK